MTWQCECGALTDSPDTRALPHAPSCPIFEGKPATIVSVYSSPETTERIRVQQNLARATEALEWIAEHPKARDSWSVAREALKDIGDAGARAGRGPGR